MFPGQGSQKRGMGQDLFDIVPEFKAAEDEINRLLGYSLRKRCLEDLGNQLSQTQFTQPCLYIVNALYYFLATAQGRRPHYLAGHSLGEYNALLAAGAFDFMTGLRLVKKRGELMSLASNGTMAAVVGFRPDKVDAVLRENGLTSLDIANYNAPAQVVISGPRDAIERAAGPLEKNGAQLYVPLPVSAAFHSRYMTDAAQSFDAFLSSFRFNDIGIPVISNATAKPYPASEPTQTIRSLLVGQIARPVLWSQSVKFLLDKGATTFAELGPGSVLSRLVEQVKKG